MLTSYNPWLLFWVPSIAFAGATLLTVVSLRVGAWFADRRVVSQPPARPVPPETPLYDAIAAVMAEKADAEWSQVWEILEGRVGPCDEMAAKCRCTKAAGHELVGDPVHSCDPGECTGQWRGHYGGTDWKVVEFPVRVRAGGDR
jgi:hypothetical protein